MSERVTWAMLAQVASRAARSSDLPADGEVVRAIYDLCSVVLSAREVLRWELGSAETMVRLWDTARPRPDQDVETWQKHAAALRSILALLENEEAP